MEAREEGSAPHHLEADDPVSVIIPTFNRSRYIAATILSILEQTRAPSQIIVVDDGSTDATPEVLQPFADKITYIRKANGGKASALNLALPLATGSLIWIFDDDDIAKPRALEAMAGALTDRSLSFVYGPYVTFSSEQQLSRLASGEEHKAIEENGEALTAKFGLHVALMFRNFIMQPGLMVRKSCYEAVGPFDERLVRAQDYDMLLRLTRHHRGRRIDEILFYQRHHRGRRGSLAAPVKAGQINEAWATYEKLIFEKIRLGHDLDEFLPPTLDDSLRAPRAAPLIRGSVMARRQLWEFAAQDFSKAIQTSSAALAPIEQAALHQILDDTNTGLAKILEAPALAKALATSRGRFRRELMAALLVPLPYVLRASLQFGPRSRARDVLRIYARFGNPLIVAQAVAAKVQSKLKRKY